MINILGDEPGVTGNVVVLTIGSISNTMATDNSKLKAIIQKELRSHFQIG